MIETVIGTIFGAGAVYGAIRQDLKRAIEQSEKANKRIDDILLKGVK